MFLLLVVEGDGLDVEDEAEVPDLLSGQYLESLTDLCLLILTAAASICKKDVLMYIKMAFGEIN